MVRGAARDHLWWWAEELPRQVGGVIASPSLGIAPCYAGAVWPPLRGPEFGSSDPLLCVSGRENLFSSGLPGKVALGLLACDVWRGCL